MKEKGNISLALYLVFAAITIIVAFGVLAPMATNISASMMGASGSLFDSATTNANTITDTNVRGSFLTAISNAKDTGTTQTQAYTSLFQYLWVAVFVVIGYILVVYARQFVQTGQQVR